MRPATKIIGFTILGAVVGALLGFLYGSCGEEFDLRWSISMGIAGAIIGALIFLVICSINELTKKKSKLVRRLSVAFLLIIVVIIGSIIVYFLSWMFIPSLHMLLLSVLKYCKGVN